jgi:hypothetical protein
MSKTTALAGALGAFGALAYLMAPLPPEEQQAGPAATASSAVIPSQPSNRKPATVARVSPPPTQLTQGQDAKVRLVQQIQTELLRLGCYAGAVDGHWSPETQLAMQALGERVRVLRPVDTPDYIMLALARSQVSLVCTPRGQSTASRQPARIVPMAGTGHAPTEPSRVAPSPRRQTERAPTAADTRTRGLPPPEVRAAATAPNRVPLDRAARQTADETMLRHDRGDSDQIRMGLGVVTVDPLRAGMDPRDPTAPAILRGPGAVTPRMASPSELDAAQSSRRLPRTTIEARRPPSPRGDWKRTVFNKLKFDGP